MATENDACPDCGHSWKAHQGRNGGERCGYRRYDGPCPCRRKNPDIEAEDRLAAALWNAALSRPAGGSERSGG